MSEDTFDNPTMVQILANQGDLDGARSLYERLKAKYPGKNLVDSALVNRLYEKSDHPNLVDVKTPDSQTYLEQLENWLKAIKEVKNGIR